MKRWIWMIIFVLHEKLFAFGDICDGSFPLLVNTASFFLPQPLTPTRGCESKAQVDNGVRYENHAILVKPPQYDDQLPSKAYLSFVDTTQSLVPRFHISVILDSYSTQWMLNTEETHDNTTFKFMVRKSSSVTATHGNIDTTHFTDDFNNVMYSYRNLLFERPIVTSFIEIDHKPIINITIGIGGEYSESVATCVPTTGLLPRRMLLSSFQSSVKYEQSCQSKLTNVHLHIIHLTNVTYNPSVTLRYYSSNLSPSNTYVVLVSTVIVDWTILMTVGDGNAPITFIINDDGSTLTSGDQRSVNVEKHDVSKPDTLVQTYNADGYTYTQHQYTQFIVFSPEGVDTLDVFSTLIGPLKRAYTEANLVEFLAQGNCDCRFDEKYKISFNKMQLESQNIEVDPLDLKFGKCDAVLRDDDYRWSVTIPNDAFETCGVTKTKTGYLRVEVSLPGNGVVHRLPTDCNPAKQVLIGQPGMSYRCQVEGVVDCSGHPQKITMRLTTQDVKSCQITVNDIRNTLSDCNVSISTLIAGQLSITFSDKRSDNCAIQQDVEGYFFDVELSPDNITMIFTDDCQQASPGSTGISGSNFEINVLSSFTSHNNRPIIFPVDIETSQSKVMFLQISSVLPEESVHIDSCGVMVTQDGGMVVEQEQLIRNNCPVNDTVRFLTAFATEDHVQHVMFDAGKILQSHGDFFIQCRLQACYQSNINMDVLCLFPHGEKCNRDDMVLYTFGYPYTLHTIRTGLFRLSAVATTSSVVMPTSLFVIVAMVSFIVALLVVMVIRFIYKRYRRKRKKHLNIKEVNSNGVLHSKNNGNNIGMTTSDANKQLQTLLNTPTKEMSRTDEPDIQVHVVCPSNLDDENDALLSKNNSPQQHNNSNQCNQIVTCTLPINFPSLQEDVI